MLVLRAVLLLAVLATKSLASEADGSTSLHANKTVSRSTPPDPVLRKQYVELGTTVTLNCTNTNIAWHDIFYVIWKIHLRHKECNIATGTNESDHDACHDGKKVNRTADGSYHLIIPNFSIQDEGNYTCDISYPAGGLIEIINVSAFAHLHISGWLEHNGTHTVAVCEATGKPPVSIHWETPWNVSSPTTQVHETTGQLPTVISRLQLPRHSDYRNITCVATSKDISHTETQFSDFIFRDTSAPTWLIILVGAICVVCFTVVLTVLYKCKNHKLLSVFRKICCKPKVSPSNEEKPQETYDPEEVQPYASYVQRVNSIYNSSAELCRK